VLSYTVLLTIPNSHNITIFGATKTFPRVLRTRLCPRRRRRRCLQLYCAVNRNWLTLRDDVTRSLAHVSPKVNACKRYIHASSYEKSRCNNIRGMMICFLVFVTSHRLSVKILNKFQFRNTRKKPIISGFTRPKGIVYNVVFYFLSTKCTQKFWTKKKTLFASFKTIRTPDNLQT